MQCLRCPFSKVFSNLAPVASDPRSRLPRNRSSLGLLLALLLALGVGLVFLSTAFAQGPPLVPVEQTIPEDGAFVPGEILVQWQDRLKIEDLTAVLKVGWSVERTLEPLRVAVVQVPQGEELAAIAQLEDLPLVVYAEPNYLGYALEAGDEPAPEAPKTPPPAGG